MNFTVVWKAEAERRLAELWVNASDRNAVTQSANHIETLLSRNPDTQGESRASGRRVLLVSPLGVIFRVNHRARIVRVVSVWQYA